MTGNVWQDVAVAALAATAAFWRGCLLSKVLSAAGPGCWPPFPGSD